jgi:transcriptional regulator with XRE-family HTH domain
MTEAMRRPDGRMRVDPEAGSTVPRRQLGRYLRQLRERAGMTIKASAEHLECSVQKIWRIEKGSVPVRGSDVLMLCQFYAATDEMTQALVSLARETKAKGWWQSYGDAVPDWFELYVSLEGAASRIRKFEPTLVPGLLQSQAYMESVISTEQPDMADEDRKHRVSIKTERQGLLSRHFPPPPRLEVIVWEAVLRTLSDRPGALEQQLFRLLHANELPNVSVQVLPLASGHHRASASGAFTILEFPAAAGAEAESPTIYIETPTGALYLDKLREFATYDEIWHALAKQALDEEESTRLITTIMKEMNGHA